ncbi:hypothetical protein P691DRAFT_780726 [Macrolepiota fuliginosa MF-IS2]|uniref:Uncharacterized protein n=1 Tax=Macrolepiota fuliginosa MF-IS2 TaxID=1400762 RepID=A0A9P6BWT9_9AGAR|nr:hypothetical protein P691DRAFT_780726 [Macrolepiota fuliginosa MF-IS2]
MFNRITREEVTVNQDQKICNMLCRIWPWLIHDSKSRGIEGLITRVIVKLNHESNSDSRTHSTIQLFDHFNHNITTFHVPMPGPCMHIPYYGINKFCNGWDFARVFEQYMEVSAWDFLFLSTTVQHSETWVINGSHGVLRIPINWGSSVTITNGCALAVPGGLQVDWKEQLCESGFFSLSNCTPISHLVDAKSCAVLDWLPDINKFCNGWDFARVFERYTEVHVKE